MAESPTRKRKIERIWSLSSLQQEQPQKRRKDASIAGQTQLSASSPTRLSVERGNRQEYEDSNDSDDDDDNDDGGVPFSIECPARAAPKNKKEKKRNRINNTADDAFGPENEDGGYQNLKISYRIRPGEKWRELKPFRNFSSEYLHQCARAYRHCHSESIC